MKRNTKNWKHTTKNRKAYALNGKTEAFDYFGDRIWVDRKQARINSKRNSPFMQDEFDTELLAGA